MSRRDRRDTPYRAPASAPVTEPTVRVVVAAIDGTRRAPSVLVMAATVAQRFGAKLYAFRAVSVPPDYPPAAHVDHPDRLPAYLEREAREEVAELLRTVPGAQAATPVVVVGDTWRAILEEARRLKADMVVMGSHGYSGIDRLLGTTTGKVTVRAPCHVLVVHTEPESG
ncbi:MAG TPA: universal stress protein [Minicystis sp.]|nr:universal stress protein [Minicystis sp.]